MSLFEEEDVCAPSDRAVKKRITPSDIRAAEKRTGFRALPSSAAIKPGSLSKTHQDVHGLYDAFTSDNLDEVDLSRPPFAKKLPNAVLTQMIDWDRFKQEQFDKLSADPVYRFLADVAAVAVIDVREFLQSKVSNIAVGSEIVESRETSEITETPEPGSQQQPELLQLLQQQQQQIQLLQRQLEDIKKQRPRKRRRSRQQQQEEQRRRLDEDIPQEDEDIPQTDIEFQASGAKAMKFIRQDFNRAERKQAYDAQSWLRRVEVVGHFAISDRAIFAINFNYTRILFNVPSLNGVKVERFMYDEHVKTNFAFLCGTFINYTNLMSRRTYIEISMNPTLVKTMDSMVLTFFNNVVWNEDRRKLVMLTGSDNLCQINPYQTVCGDCVSTSLVAFCPSGTHHLKLFP